MSFTNSEQTPEWELGDVIRIDLDDDDDEAEVVVEVDRATTTAKTPPTERDEIPTFLIGIDDNRG